MEARFCGCMNVLVQVVEESDGRSSEPCDAANVLERGALGLAQADLVRGKDSIKRSNHFGKQSAPSSHVRGIRVCERIARKNPSYGFHHHPGRGDFSDEDGVPALLDLRATCGELENRRQVIEVLSGINLAPLVALVMEIVLELSLQLVKRKRTVRGLSSNGAIKVDVNKDAAKVKQQRLRGLDGHEECRVRLTQS